MKVPFNWLKDFVDIDISVEALADKLVFAGFEIEEIIYLRDNIKNVVTGKILSISKHENSDNLQICQIDCGKQNVQIVTGAKNVTTNDIVPVALDGAVLHNGQKIVAGNLRGVDSFGMLCGLEELGVDACDFDNADNNGILILDKNTAIGVDINDIIGNNEVILDVAITANRPDCNSVFGMAREVAAVLNKPIKTPNFFYKYEDNTNINDFLKIENQNYQLCPRYMAKVLVDIKVEKSPKIIRDRLKSVGIRPINNLVDITNYVLVELGQPMHAFDLDTITDNKIVIRTAKNENIIALDDKNYQLNENMLAICDSNAPIAVAGVMGGAKTAVSENTTKIALESARFARDSVRHTSRALNLHSDSSARFEKGIDFLSQEMGMNRALAIFYQYKWGKIIDGCIDMCQTELVEKVITYTSADINNIVGVDIPTAKMADILSSLDLKTVATNNNLTTTIPIYREDIDGVNDIAEEIIRIYGYEHIEPKLSSNMRGGKTEKQLRLDKLKNILSGKGGFEICSYSFIPPKAFDLLNLDPNDGYRKAIKIKNPLTVDLSVMRTTLAYSMLKTIAYNYARGNKDFCLYEIASVYQPYELPLTRLPNEHPMLCIGMFGDGDYYKLKAIIEDIADIFGLEFTFDIAKSSYLHPGRSANILSKDNKIIGYLGEVHPDVAKNFDVDRSMYIAEIDVDYILSNALDIKPFKQLSKYQAMERDLALLAPIDMPARQIIDSVVQTCSDILENTQIFDIYVGGQIPFDKKSVAIKLTFRDNNRTLKDAEVNKEITKVLQSLELINVFLR